MGTSTFSKVQAYHKVCREGVVNQATPSVNSVVWEYEGCTLVYNWANYGYPESRGSRSGGADSR